LKKDAKKAAEIEIIELVYFHTFVPKQWLPCPNMFQ